MSDTATIDPQHAADLYELLDGHGQVDPNPPMDDTCVAHNWVLYGSSPLRTSRWHDRYWMVIGDANDGRWGIEYGIGLTEEQEDDLPWEDGGDRLLALTRLYPHEVTRVEYRTTPATTRPAPPGGQPPPGPTTRSNR